MNALFVGAVWGHSVGGQLFQPLPEDDKKTGQIVTAAIVAELQVSSSHQAPAAPSPWVSARGATSALIFLFLGGQVEGEVVGWGRKAFTILFAM